MFRIGWVTARRAWCVRPRLEAGDALVLVRQHGDVQPSATAAAAAAAAVAAAAQAVRRPQLRSLPPQGSKGL